MILHLTSKQAWQSAQAAGDYRAESLTSEGFIHCSREDQILKVAETFYKGQTDLILLELDADKLSSELKWEPPAGLPPHGVTEDDKFPHIYGAINLNAVINVHTLETDKDGTFYLPANLIRE